jgi:hypothetical protein
MGKKTDWLKVLGGALAIAVAVGDTPLIPDEPVLIPAGLVLIMDGMKW